VTTSATRRELLRSTLPGTLAVAGCITIDGDASEVPVTIRADVVDVVPENATVVPVENESIAGSPLEASARDAVAGRGRSMHVDAERSGEVSSAFDELPISDPPEGMGSGGVYVRVGDVVVILEAAWPG